MGISVLDAVDVLIMINVPHAELMLNIRRHLMLILKKVDRRAKVPSVGSRLASGQDLYAIEDVAIAPGHHVLVRTGLAVESVEDAYGVDIQIRSRSGMAAKHAVFVLNSPGTIDADYRGEIKVILMNLGDETYHISRGDRIAQMVLGALRSMPVLVREIDSESVPNTPTKRGHGGFGSTGK
jgi:dUTP pyrophosphatase